MISRPDTLDTETWVREAQQHAEKARALIGPYLARREQGEKHPVYDFLFEYYSFRPGHLATWSPGYGISLEAGDVRRYLSMPGFIQRGPLTHLDAEKFPRRRMPALRWVVQLLRATSVRTPRFGCFGLHEWAMAFEEKDIRHGQVPLRLPHRDVARIVREGPVCCSHFDAFRFFSKTARPLNQVQPTGSTRHSMEQRGCLHVNMDLYKWAYKFYPWTPSALILDAFELAWRIREIDMRASPYDLGALGFPAIPIETPEGREQYRALQAQFAEVAQPLRQRLLRHYDRLLFALENPHPNRVGKTADFR